MVPGTAVQLPFSKHAGAADAPARRPFASLLFGFRVAMVLAWLAVMSGMQTALAAKPQRIVSLNLCTDQLLMMLVPPERIAALSYLSQDPASSVMHEEAGRHRVVHAQAEEVFLLDPDLVLTSTFVSRTTTDILRRLGFRVEEIPPAYGFEEIRANIARMGELVGEPARAAQLVASFDADLARLAAARTATAPLAAFYYSNAYTAGSGTLADEILEAAGMRNLGRELGLQQTTKLPLEVLVLGNPDVVIRDRDFGPPALAQEVYRHPALRYLEKRSSGALVADKYMICGTPHAARAVSGLLAVARSLVRNKAAGLAPLKPRAMPGVTVRR